MFEQRNQEEQVTRTSCSNMEAQRSSQESSIRTMKEESWGFFYRCMFTSHVLVCACALKLCPRVEQVLDSRLLDIQDKVVMLPAMDITLKNISTRNPIRWIILS